MQVLTPTGYVNIEDLNVGDEVIAYDINDGHVFTNILEAKDKWTYDMFPPVPPVYETDAEGNIVYDEDGNPIILVPGKTSEQVFEETYGEWKFYLINNTWTLFWGQSVWANMNIVHANELQVGDIVYDDNDNDVVITDIQEVTAPDWWRLTISGDHSYIADDLTLHNASRYWVGGGSSANWNATGNTNWGSTSGGANNATVPTSVDDAIFDGVGTNGNTSSIISATITILSLNITAGYTATMTHNAVLTIAGNLTFGANYVMAGTSGITLSTNSTITSNGRTWINSMSFQGASTTKTLVGNLTISGGLTCGANGNIYQTINRTTTEVLTIAGGFAVSDRTWGTIEVTLTSGTITNVRGALSVRVVNFNGNITFSGAINFGEFGAPTSTTINYVSGTLTSPHINTNSATLFVNASGVTWSYWNVIASTINLQANTTTNSFSSSQGSGCVINTSNSSVLTVNGNISLTTGVSGTASFLWTSGTLSAPNSLNGLAVSTTIAGNVTFSGTCYLGQYNTAFSLIYQSGTVTTTGSTLAFSGLSTITLNTNGITWNNVAIANSSGNGNPTLSLTSNLNISGSLTVNASASVSIGTSNSSTVNIANGLTLNGSCGGSAKVILTGGTWSGGSTISNNLDIQGNVTVSGSVFYGTGTLTYVSGTVTTTGSTLNLVSAGITLNTNGINWNNITASIAYNGQRLIVLTSNLNINGLLNISTGGGVTPYIVQINKTTSEVINCFGGLRVTNTGSQAAGLSGSADIYLKGGTWDCVTGGELSNNLFIDGNVTISGTVGYRGGSVGGTLRYLSGIVTTTGSTLAIGNGSGGGSYTATLNTNGITWNNISTVTNASFIVLASNLSMTGLFTVGVATTINQSTTQTWTVSGGITNTAACIGTVKIIMTGGTWSGGGGISNSLDFQGNVTVSGTVNYGAGTMTYVSGTIVTTGTTIGFSGSTLNTNGITWVNVNTGAGTITLTSNFNMTGALGITGATVINTSTSRTWTVGNGIAVNATCSGTAKIILTGGTWSGTDLTGLSSSLDIQGNVTLSGTVRYGGGTLTYVSGTVTVTGTTFTIRSSCTLNTNGITWNNVSTAAVSTVTLTSNFTINGLLNIISGGGLTVNKTTSERIIANGGITTTNGIGGTADLYWQGGTWTVGIGGIGSPLFINGNVTMPASGNLSGASVTYLSGDVNNINCTLALGGATMTIDTKGLLWNNVTSDGTTKTVTFASDFDINGTLTISGTTTFNTNNGSIINVNNGFTMNVISTGALQGTAGVYLNGGIWTSIQAGHINLPFFINGNITINGTVNYSGGTITYLRGNINSDNGILAFPLSASAIGFNKVGLRAIQIGQSRQVTMDQCFRGTPGRICTISSQGGLTCILAFTNPFEKIAENIACTSVRLATNMQLISASNPRIQTNKATNLGFRYGNGTPNGFPKNAPMAKDTMVYPALGLVSDPNFTKQG